MLFIGLPLVAITLSVIALAEQRSLVATPPGRGYPWPRNGYGKGQPLPRKSAAPTTQQIANTQPKGVQAVGADVSKLKGRLDELQSKLDSKSHQFKIEGL